MLADFSNLISNVLEKSICTLVDGQIPFFFCHRDRVTVIFPDN